MNKHAETANLQEKKHLKIHDEKIFLLSQTETNAKSKNWLLPTLSY